MIASIPIKLHSSLKIFVVAKTIFVLVLAKTKKFFVKKQSYKKIFFLSFLGGNPIKLQNNLKIFVVAKTIFVLKDNFFCLSLSKDKNFFCQKAIL